MKRNLVLAMLLAVAALTTACNTVQGVGKDVERGGEKLQNASKDAQKNN